MNIQCQAKIDQNFLWNYKKNRWFMMKINVYSEKSGNFGANSEKKPMIIIESRKRPLEPGQKDKNGKPILSLKEKYPDANIFNMYLWDYSHIYSFSTCCAFWYVSKIRLINSSTSWIDCLYITLFSSPIKKSQVHSS